MINWLNVELTSKCQKSCHFCGRAEARKNNELELGDMDLELLREIVSQFKGDIIQFNKDGEPLLYDNLWEVGQICKNYITNIVTNGLLLWGRRGEIIHNFTTVTVSVVENDIEQLENVEKFIEYKGSNRPQVLIKFLGDYYNPVYERKGLQTMKRSIHNPKGDTDYIQSKPPIPEIGVCLDFLYKPSIDWKGNFYICNRFDLEGKGIIGDCEKQTLQEIWDSPLRQEWLELHKQGKRNLIPLCKSCQFFGIPAC